MSTRYRICRTTIAGLEHGEWLDITLQEANERLCRLRVRHPARHYSLEADTPLVKREGPREPYTEDDYWNDRRAERRGK